MPPRGHRPDRHAGFADSPPPPAPAAYEALLADGVQALFEPARCDCPLCQGGPCTRC